MEKKECQKKTTHTLTIMMMNIESLKVFVLRYYVTTNKR